MMSVVVEVGIIGIFVIGFLLLDYLLNVNFEFIKLFVKKIILECLENGLLEGVVFNVNFFKFFEKEIKGIKVCR